MSTNNGRGFQRAGFIALWVIGGIAQQVQRDARAGVLSAKSLWRRWMTEYWPRVPRPVRAPFFAVGVSARAVYRAGHHASRTVVIGVRAGSREGEHRYREHLELREHPRGTQGYVHTLGRIDKDRQSRAEAWRRYGDQFHGTAVQLREEKRAWARATTLEELGEVTARWADGDIKYHPGGYDQGPDPETLEIIPALAALNRSGFVTASSQPGIGPVTGYDGHTWWQRAAVDGYTDPDTADRLEDACAAAGLIFINNGPARWRTTSDRRECVTASFVNKGDGALPPEASDELYYGHTGFGTHLSRRAVKFDFNGYGTHALLNAEQVTIIDPVWGRKDHLWLALVGDAHIPTENSGDTGDEHEAHDLPMLTSIPAGADDSDLSPTHPGPYTEEDGHWQVNYPYGPSPVRLAGFNRDYAEQLAAYARWRDTTPPGVITVTPMPEHLEEFRNKDGDLHFGGNPEDPNGIGECSECGGTATKNHGICPSCRARGAIRNADHDQRRPKLSVKNMAKNNDGGSEMTAPATSSTANTSQTGVGDAVTTPRLREFYAQNEKAWAELQDHVTHTRTWCEQAQVNLEAIAGQLAADRHDSATIAEAGAVLDAVHRTGQIAEQFVAAVEAGQAAFAQAHRGLDRARTAEDAHASFPGGGPAKNFDAYAPQ